MRRWVPIHAAFALLALIGSTCPSSAQVPGSTGAPLSTKGTVSFPVSTRPASAVPAPPAAGIPAAPAVLIPAVGIPAVPKAVIPTAPVPAVPVATVGDPAVLVAEEQVAKALVKGRELETQRRWSEALTWYEEALRQYPQHQSLEQRLHLTRIHYDLSGRYGDAAYRDSLNELSRDRLMELYDEVLTKIQSHYVEPPHWQQLVDSGTAGLMEALLDPLFLEHNLPNVPQPKVETFRRLLNDRIFGARTADRQGAINVAAYAAKLASEQLGLRETAVIYEYVAGAAGGLDPYSTFLSTGKLNEVYSQIEGNFVGLGVELKSSDGSLLIVKTFAGGPADRAGIRPGDRITAVAGRSMHEISTDQAANLLQGPEGSSVDVTVISPGQSARALRVRREQVEVPSIDDVKIVDPQLGVGYLRLTCFQKTTSRDLDTALWKLHREGMKSLIMDLRGNPGGLLNISVDIVDKFVADGVIVSTRGRNPNEDYSYTAHRPNTWQVPLVVLIDGDSASASEIFAGAIRDHHRGTIVGARSYGKGSVQGIYPLNTINGGIRLTTAKFYSPNGHPFARVGVEPDVAVEIRARPTDSGQMVAGQTDPAMDAALSVARRQPAAR